MNAWDCLSFNIFINDFSETKKKQPINEIYSVMDLLTVKMGKKLQEPRELNNEQKIK